MQSDCEVEGQPSHPTVVRSWNVRIPAAFGRYIFLIVLCYGALTTLGLTTSSIGILREGSARPAGLLYGHPRAIRSDEYLRSTPILIGEARFRKRIQDHSQSQFTPLDHRYTSPQLGVDGQFVESQYSGFLEVVGKILAPDSTFIKNLPISQQLSAEWWRGTLFLFLGIALIFESFQLSWYYSLSSSVLVWFSPATQWWSLWPLDSVGVASLAVGFGLIAAQNVRVSRGDMWSLSRMARRIFAPLLAALVLAMRLPSIYQPWSIVVAPIFLGIAVGGWISLGLSLRELKRSTLVVLALGVTCGIPQMVLVFSRIGNAFSTVYPGGREYIGVANYPLWGSALSWQLQNSVSDSVNQSELAIGAIILVIPVFAVLVVGRASRGNHLYWPLVISSAFAAVFILWTMSVWPRWLALVTQLQHVPPERVLQIVGVVLPFIFILALAFVRTNGVPADSLGVTSVCSGVLAAVLSLSGGSSLRAFLPWVSAGSIWATALICGVLVWWPLRQRFFRTSIFFVCIAAILSSIRVNPLMQGLGIFGESKGQTVLRAAIEKDDRRWASDSFLIDAVATAAGMRLLSGNQGAGPNYAAYVHLDPLKRDINKWNRAGSYVTFQWTHDDEVTIENPSPDVVLISIDPCNKILDEFDVAWVASSGDQNGFKCLQLEGLFPLNELTIRLYHRS